MNRRPVQHERREQAKLIAELAKLEHLYPDLALIFAIPNGGKRNIREAALMKLEGVRAGVPDLFLPVPRLDFCGLFIEMKHGKNKPTKPQQKWHSKLAARGYKVVVCYSWFDAVNVIGKYLNVDLAQYFSFNTALLDRSATQV